MERYETKSEAVLRERTIKKWKNTIEFLLIASFPSFGEKIHF